MGGAEPGGGLYSKCGPESAGALNVASAMVVALGIEEMPQFARSAAVVDACRRAPS